MKSQRSDIERNKIIEDGKRVCMMNLFDKVKELIMI